MSRFGVCFQTFICAIIKPYYWTAYRVRSWGRLPWRRAATLVLCNHQHDLDTNTTIVQMQLAGPTVIVQTIRCVRLLLSLHDNRAGT